MKRSPEIKRSTLPLYLIIFFLCLLIIFGIVEFRYLNNILNSYESSIEQIAVNKTNSFLNRIEGIAENVARRIELKHIGTDDQSLQSILPYDRRITNAYVVHSNGHITSTSNLTDIAYVSSLATSVKTKQTAIISDLNYDEFLKLNVVSAAVPLADGNVLVMDFRIDEYQKQVIEEFNTTNYKIAVLDSNNLPIIWPFPEEDFATFNLTQSKISINDKHYLIVDTIVSQTQWRVVLFKQDTNFEKYRSVLIIFLVFALYYCIYQLLVEFWGVNSAKTYFDNIDFAILNQVNEGIIITNNAGVIVFANNVAHQLFSDRKNNLINVQLKDIMGHIENIQGNHPSSQRLTLKTSDKLMEAMHSPIIKKGKRLGSLSVIRVYNGEEKAYRNVLEKLMEITREGVVFVDENNQIVTANLIAKMYLGNLDSGKSIEGLDAKLAEFIIKNIDSRSINRFKLESYHILCDVAPIYDNDGVYIGTLIVMFDHDK
ncbi:PAS domain-containing protein [Peptococcaceae bacterium 1198_IL3148]